MCSSCYALVYERGPGFASFGFFGVRFEATARKMSTKWTRVKAKQKAKNDLDEMDAAASKLALAHKKLCLRRVLIQVRHQVRESVDLCVA